jgi:putative DNA primase/helicase
VGKRLNVVAELPEADILTTETFKGVIDGSPQSAKIVYAPVFTFRPEAGHLFACNTLPGTSDQSYGFWRRFIVILWTKNLKEENEEAGLGKTIITVELPAIVSWFIDGACTLLKRGRFDVPESCLEAKRAWQKAADPVRMFVDEWTVAEPDLTRGTLATQLYTAFTKWCGINGHKPMSSAKFAKRMVRARVPSEHTRAGQAYPVRLSTEVWP